MRTRVMRRRSASRTSTASPSISNCSPTAGTRPSRDSRKPPTVSNPSPSEATLQPIGQLLDVRLAAEHEAPVALVDDRLGLDVVLVADLADDLLDQVLERHQPGGAAVLVHDDGHLQAVALELAQQLDHALGLGHEDGGPEQRRDRRLRIGRRPPAGSGPSRRRTRGRCRAMSWKTGTREYCCSRNSVRSCSSVASALTATMSGRGVITSRTSVSRKSTSVRSIARAWPSCSGSGSPVWSRVRLGRSSRSRILAVAARGLWPLAPASSCPRAAARAVIGDSRRATASNDGSSTSSTRSGIAPDDDQRDDVLAEQRRRPPSTRPAAGKPAWSTPVTRASSAAASNDDDRRAASAPG